MTRPLAAIVLAAGRGTRMKSDLHKVMHPIAGRPMLAHLLDSVAELGPSHVVIVVGSGRDQLEALIAAHDGTLVIQPEQLGTAHAVLQARPELENFDGDILILYGDTPFVSTDTMRRMRDRLQQTDAPAVVVVASRPADPKHYGRIVTGDGDTIVKMVEYKDASAEERAIDLCNSGLMAVRAEDLWSWLERVGNDNEGHEYYLPDIVMRAIEDGRASMVVEVEADEVEGVNSRAELARLEALWQKRRREAMMENGVSLVAPETVWFAFDTTIGRDSVVEPHVVFGPGVSIGQGVRIRGFSHIEGAEIGAGAEIGPFARLRPGTTIGEEAKVGNFVEVKKSTLGKGAKANHLSYLGDSDIGERANIGAGTITCNYDGFFKYRTVIGEGAFIGSNTALVAPVSIGPGALVAAGSVITRDVLADAVAVARGEQVDKEGRARLFREKMLARKSKAT